MCSPTISVLMPVYNSQATVAPAIESILRQTYEDFELIVINDGSTDSSQTEIAKFAHDPRVNIISQQNVGLVQALNTGLEYCSGEFIARMDSDDISLPNRFELQINFFRQNRSIDVLSGSYIAFDGALPTNQTSRLVVHPSEPEVIHWMLKYYCVIAHPAVMFRRSVVLSGHKYNDVPAEDLDLWRQISNGHNISNLDDILLYYRTGTESLSKKNNDQIRDYHKNAIFEASKPKFYALVVALMKVRGVNRIGVLWRWIND